MVAVCHECKFAVDAEVLIPELQRTRWRRELRRDGTSKCFRMCDNGREVFDADNNMRVLLHVEVLKVFGMDRNRCLEWLFKHLYGFVLAKT